MDIIYLGHSSFRLKGKSTSLVTDPFDKDMLGLKYPKIEADIVTISHDHQDHNVTSAVENVHKVVDGPGEYEILGVSIIGLSTFHDDKKGELRGKNTIYVIEIDGLRIAHLGDLGHKLTESKLSDIGTIDILMIPVGGIYTIEPTIAANITRGIEPSVTIPMHYFNPDLNEETFGKLAKVETFLSEVGLTVERMKKLSVKSGNLSEEKKVVVLEI